MDTAVQIAYVVGILICGIFAVRTTENQPYRVDVCHVWYDENGKFEKSTNVWSDQLEWFMNEYPESYCGRCGRPMECP